MVLATQDGAGSENWMKSALKKNVPNITILNGVDQKNKLTNTKLLKNIPNNKFIAIFVGRLEHDKAPDKFIESFLLAKKKLPNNLHIIIVGTGSMKEKLDLSLEKANATKDVTFFSNLNTDEIFFLLDKSDVYISLNRYGNLSNTNIEAMTRGKAMIIPRSNRYKGIDIYTDSLIPRDSVIRIKDSDSINDVAEALIYLFNNEKAKISLEKNISNISNQYIKSWDKRIAWEFKLLNIINSGRQDKLRSFIEDVEL
jgi:glycosyltransferase involved in cell wall biosynthesis